jgi:hypothetical protein
MKLRKLKPEALKHTDSSFFKGEREIKDQTLEKYVEAGETDIDYEKLREVLEEAMEDFDEGDTALDAEVAPKIHEIFDLTRREAADPQVWNYLSLKFCPEFVRHRWTSHSEDRFIADRTLAENAFSRMWWVAELTKKDGNYDLTKVALSKQEIAQSIITDNNFSHYQDLVPKILESVKDENSKVVAKYGEILNRRFAVRLLESLDENDTEELAETVKYMAREKAGKDVDEESSSKLLSFIRG